jgi:hypothetical protein
MTKILALSFLLATTLSVQAQRQTDEPRINADGPRGAGNEYSPSVNTSRDNPPKYLPSSRSDISNSSDRGSSSSSGSSTGTKRAD